jgi:hypothetical protein
VGAFNFRIVEAARLTQFGKAVTRQWRLFYYGHGYSHASASSRSALSGRLAAAPESPFQLGNFELLNLLGIDGYFPTANLLI